jgi:hypothetical protein
MSLRSSRVTPLSLAGEPKLMATLVFGVEAAPPVRSCGMGSRNRAGLDSKPAPDAAKPAGCAQTRRAVKIAQVGVAHSSPPKKVDTVHITSNTRNPHLLDSKASEALAGVADAALHCLMNKDVPVSVDFERKD